MKKNSKPGSQGQENDDKSTTRFEMEDKFLSIENEDQDLLIAKLQVIPSKWIKCQKQSGSNDCGLFAIATATAFCSGILPSSRIWDQSAMRIHLVNCFESRLMMPFTSKLEPNIVKEDIARTEVISV